MTFRLKLLASMVLLVVSITATTLLITENQVRASYQRHFQRSFQDQVDSFLQQRKARLEPVEERVSAVAGSTRILAAMENARQSNPDQRDIDDLYQYGLNQLSEVIGARGFTNGAQGFCFFLNSDGRLLYPSSQVELPFSLLTLRRIVGPLEAVGVQVARGELVAGWLSCSPG